MDDRIIGKELDSEAHLPSKRRILSMPTTKVFRRFLALPVLAFLFTNACLCDEPVGEAPQAENGLTISGLTKRLRDSQARVEATNDVKERIREATWRLLVGESALNSDTTMFSAALDSSSEGLKDLEQLNDELLKNEDLQRQVAAAPQVAVRLDLALNEREATKKTIALARNEELLRLKQLREVNRKYRALIEDLMASQTEILLGNSTELSARLKSAGEHLREVEQVLAERKDFYLFSDEPDVNDTGDEDLKVVKTLALPYSESTILHQELVSAHAQLQAALSSSPVDAVLLKSCLDALSRLDGEEVSENAVFHYIRGVASMELGLVTVGDRIWDLAAHTEASPHLVVAQGALQAALNKLPALPSHQKQKADIASRLAILKDEESALAEVSTFSAQDNDNTRSLAVLDKAARAQGSAKLFIAWVYTRWQLELIDAVAAKDLLTQAAKSQLLKPDDHEVLLTIARMTALDAWAEFQAPTPNLQLETLEVTRANLQSLQLNADVYTQLEAKSLIALLDVMTSGDAGPSLDDAMKSFSDIGTTAAELEARWTQADPIAKSRLASAASVARLAEGYLAVRFESTESNRAQIAFASAAAISMNAPHMRVQPFPNAVVLLRTMLTRDDAANLRLALAERQLRMALQKSFPAVAASSIDASVENTSNLVREVQGLIASRDGDSEPASQLDPRELSGSQVSVRNDSASVAAFTLLNSKRPSEAITILLQAIDDKFKPGDDISAVNWTDTIQRVESTTDPLMRCAFAESLEYYAADALDSKDPQKQLLLKEALAIQNRLADTLEKESFWNGKWPFLKTRVNNSKVRLTDASGFLIKAASLRSNMELPAARQLLSDGTARFPENSELRIEFVQTLLDESETNHGEREALLQQGLAMLNGLPANELNSTALLKAAELHEQLGNNSAAISAYEAVSEAAPSTEHSLIARSRLSSLRLSLAAQ